MHHSILQVRELKERTFSKKERNIAENETKYMTHTIYRQTHTGCNTYIRLHVTLDEDVEHSSSTKCDFVLYNKCSGNQLFGWYWLIQIGRRLPQSWTEKWTNGPSMNNGNVQWKQRQVKMKEKNFDNFQYWRQYKMTTLFNVIDNNIFGQYLTKDLYRKRSLRLETIKNRLVLDASVRNG